MNEAQKKQVLKSLEEKIASIDEKDLVWVVQKIGCNTRNEDGGTVLHTAAMKGLGDVCASLLSAGVDSKLLNDGGQTAADIALEAGNLDLALVLRSRESNCPPCSPAQESASDFVPTHVNRGQFSPTASTRFLDDATNWKIPEELDDSKEARSSIASSMRSDALTLEAEKISRYLRNKKIPPEKSVAAIYIRFSNFMQALKRTNPLSISKHESELYFPEEVVGVVEVLLDANDVADSIISKAYAVEDTLKKLCENHIENLGFTLNKIEQKYSVLEAGGLAEIIRNDVFYDCHFEGVSELIYEIKEFANYLDSRSTEELNENRALIVKYLHASKKLQNLTSGLCDFFEKNIFVDHDSGERYQDDCGWIRPDLQIEVPVGLLDLFSDEFKNDNAELEPDDIIKLMDWDERLWR